MTSARVCTCVLYLRFVLIPLKQDCVGHVFYPAFGHVFEERTGGDAGVLFSIGAPLLVD